MKQLILTGLATEQSFEKGGTPKYFLVFNNGQFRVPVPEATAEAVVQEMISDVAPAADEEEQEIPQQNGQPVLSPVEGYGSLQDEDGIDQI
jgi:hypothetical protein